MWSLLVVLLKTSTNGMEKLYWKCFDILIILILITLDENGMINQTLLKT